MKAGLVLCAATALLAGAPQIGGAKVSEVEAVDVSKAGPVVGRGAAGVTELGRPVDVLRPRAERLARDRAIEDLAVALAASGMDPDAARKLVRMASDSGDTRWEITYHLNGAVTATIAVE